ncbi:hypothetical protein [Actinoplanes sp. NPDC023714]
MCANAHDIEDYEVATNRVVTPGEMAALLLDAVVAAHRAYAVRRAALP